MFWTLVQGINNGPNLLGFTLRLGYFQVGQFTQGKLGHLCYGHMCRGYFSCLAGSISSLGSPYREMLDLAILRLSEDGFLDRLEREWYYDRGGCREYFLHTQRSLQGFWSRRPRSQTGAFFAQAQISNRSIFCSRIWKTVAQVSKTQMSQRSLSGQPNLWVKPTRSLFMPALVCFQFGQPIQGCVGSGCFGTVRGWSRG